MALYLFKFNGIIEIESDDPDKANAELDSIIDILVNATKNGIALSYFGPMTEEEYEKKYLNSSQQYKDKQ